MLLPLMLPLPGIVIIATCLCATYAVMDVHKMKRGAEADLNAPLIR